MEARSSSPVLKVGDLVTCPRCNMKLAHVLRDIKWGDRLDAVDFRAIAPQMIANGLMAISHCCGVPWFGTQEIGCTQRIHTGQGWKP